MADRYSQSRMPEANVTQLPPNLGHEATTGAVQDYKEATTQQRQMWDFEQKSKDTITAIGEIWGYTPLLLTLLGVGVGGIFRKRIFGILKTLTKKVV